jgi:hypothetical protein
MRIDRRKQTASRARRLADEIAEAVESQGVDGRVCRETCTIVCPTCGSTACQCACSPHCPQAPQALSSDPEKHPVEPAIMPLVYEMVRLGTFRPCWSCEGHLGKDGALWKVPRVWFYCDSVALPRLLSDGLKDLRHAGSLSTSWQVVVTFSDRDNPDTTFSLEPVDPPDRLPSLAAL